MERSSDKHLSMQLARRERCRERMSITSLINGTDSSTNSHAHVRNADRQSNAPSAVLVVNTTANVVLPQDLQGNTPSPIWNYSLHEINSKRPTRPPYTEEQKFFIMFARVLDQQSWLDIEDRFLEVFGRPASRDGLTSMYYRIRKSW